MDTALQLRGVSKSFPGVCALHGVDFDLRKGEVHAITGENGAGKSTLIKLIAGVYIPDEGEILVKGERVDFKKPGDAIAAGIGVVHQELSLFSDLTVMENMFVGRLPTKGPLKLLDRKKMQAEAAAVYERLGVRVDVTRRVAELSIAERQMLEIAKALAVNSEVLLLDEPTAALSHKEVQTLFAIIRQLKQAGVSIIYISHRLEEVFAIAQRVTVLRDGDTIATADVQDIDTTRLIGWMVGRSLDNYYPKVQADIGDVVLEVEGLCMPGVVKNVSFTLRRGEVVGLSGLAGAGRTETALLLAGLAKKSGGSIRLFGKPVNIRSYRNALDNGIVYISEDRQKTGLTLPMSVKDNITLAALRSISRFGFINAAKDVGIAREYIQSFNIATPSYNSVVADLSGGNQQKVSVARGLATDPKILILDEPTRGVDVGAKTEIYNLIGSFIQKGMSILMISSELPEILSMSDRILVLREGEVAGCVAKQEATQESLLAMALQGGGKEAAS